MLYRCRFFLTREQGTVEIVDFSNGPAPQKAKSVLSARTTFFSVSQGVINLNSLPGEERRIATNQCYLAQKEVPFHHSNALNHTSAIAMTKFVKIGYKPQILIRYSSELALCDFILSPRRLAQRRNLKTSELKKKH